jgi:hypothetical protein
MTCKDICIRHRAQKPAGLARYASGQKRCQMCEIYIRWDGLWCPCCGSRLRTKPRNSTFKQKFSNLTRQRMRMGKESQAPIIVSY